MKQIPKSVQIGLGVAAIASAAMLISMGVALLGGGVTFGKGPSA